MKKPAKSTDSKGSKAILLQKKKTTSKKIEQKKSNLISKTEFCKRCGLSPGNLSNYINRGKVIVTDKKIDLELIDNIEFLKERRRKIEGSEQSGSLESQLKRVEIKKKKQEINLLELKEQKTIGALIPTEMVKILFIQHSKSILTAFDNSIDKILTKISKVKKLTNAERSKLSGELKAELNTAVDRSIGESKSNIRKMIFEYTEVRGIGERQ